MAEDNTVGYILNAVTAIIGIYMIFAYWGAAQPPVLSGVAFVLIAAAQYMAHS